MECGERRRCCSQNGRANTKMRRDSLYCFPIMTPNINTISYSGDHDADVGANSTSSTSSNNTDRSNGVKEVT